MLSAGVLRAHQGLAASRFQIYIKVCYCTPPKLGILAGVDDDSETTYKPNPNRN